MYCEAPLRVFFETNISRKVSPRTRPSGVRLQVSGTSSCAAAGSGRNANAPSPSSSAAAVRGNVPTRGNTTRRRAARARCRRPAEPGWGILDQQWKKRPERARAVQKAGWIRLCSTGARNAPADMTILSALGSRLSALGSRLSALGSRLSALGSRLSALGSRLSALGSRLSALGSRLSALGSRLSALGSRLSALGSLILPPASYAAPAAIESAKSLFLFGFTLMQASATGASLRATPAPHTSRTTAPAPNQPVIIASPSTP